jgi:hypothetical protein
VQVGRCQFTVVGRVLTIDLELKRSDEPTAGRTTTDVRRQIALRNSY